jgi:uncharacterized protein
MSEIYIINCTFRSNVVFLRKILTTLIGRTEEFRRLKQAIDDDKSHFIALYGRRRVGKTILIKEYFDNQFTFYCTGLLKGNKKQQLANFTVGVAK